MLLCCSLFVAAATVAAQPVETASARLLARPAVQWLSLSAAQLAQLQTLGREHERRLAELEGQLASPGKKADATAAAQVCEQARAADGRHRSAARAVLEPPQQERLAMLEEALALTQVAVSAQGLGLVAPAGDGAPAGLSGSAVKARITWQPVRLAPLPGCPATQVVPELDMERGARAQPARP